jgi:hypothetical protein
MDYELISTTAGIPNRDRPSERNANNILLLLRDPDLNGS